MEIYERIRQLRKDYLHLSQSAFGERLGVNRDVINNIENNRLSKPEQKLSLIKLMCKEFSVNEDWLLNGNKPMFVQPDSFSLDRFAKEHGCTELECEILKAYFELDQETRLAVVNHFRERLTSSKEQTSLEDATPALAGLEPTPVLNLAEELAELKRQNQQILAQNRELLSQRDDLAERVVALEQEEDEWERTYGTA